MPKIFLPCLWLIFAVGCSASKHERQGLEIVNRSASYLERVVVFDDQAKEGRRVLNIPLKGLSSFYPLGLPLRGTLTVTVLKEGNQWYESRFSLEKYRATGEGAETFFVCIGDAEISLATGSDPEKAVVFETARMEKVDGPPARDGG